MGFPMYALFYRILRIVALGLACMPLFFPAALLAQEGQVWAESAAFQVRGNSLSAVERLRAEANNATRPEDRARASGELGIVLMHSNRFVEAEEPLKQAYAFFSLAPEGSLFAVYLGDLALSRKQPTEAGRYYQLARQTAGSSPEIVLMAWIKLAHLLPPGARSPELNALAESLTLYESDPRFAPHFLRLGKEERLLGDVAALDAFRHLDRARALARVSGDYGVLGESLDALAQFYEDQGRPEEAMFLGEQGATLLAAPGAAASAEWKVRLEWRQGRLNRTLGHDGAALAAYQRAQEQISAAGQEIPIETNEGESIYRALIEPVFLGYIDLLLRHSASQPDALREKSLRRAVEAVESLRQTELQDFLGDRCSVESVRDEAVTLARDTAILYPVALADRLELLLSTSTGIVRRTVSVSQETLAVHARRFADELRNGSADFLPHSQGLYRWLVEPLAADIFSNGIGNLVVVPEGVLRLVPFGALHDGSSYVIERLAVSMVTGLSATQVGPPVGHGNSSLLAGVSIPGPVVEKMMQMLKTAESEASDSTRRGGLAQSRPTRTLRNAVANNASGDESERTRRSIERYRETLSLPGVKGELDSLGKLLAGTGLIDSGFTVAHFQSEAGQGNYRIVHIASHGVFGGSAESSFIMAYDDVMTLGSFEALLRSENVQKTPIELLALSACQTAEGNDRAPLGFAGVAIKARARSVLGTLWPVEDGAARRVMSAFYAGLVKAGQSKTEALRQAQLELVRDEKSSHPFFWAPFVLIGNWL